MDPKIGFVAPWNLQQPAAKSIFSWGIPDPRYATSEGPIKFWIRTGLDAVLMGRSTVGVVWLVDFTATCPWRGQNHDGIFSSRVMNLRVMVAAKGPQGWMCAFLGMGSDSGVFVGPSDVCRVRNHPAFPRCI
jgi:hypothetical protein